MIVGSVVGTSVVGASVGDDVRVTDGTTLGSFVGLYVGDEESKRARVVALVGARLGSLVIPMVG